MSDFLNNLAAAKSVAPSDQAAADTQALIDKYSGPTAQPNSGGNGPIPTDPRHPQ